jgi:heme-degrading monooxygenase HmoA
LLPLVPWVYRARERRQPPPRRLTGFEGEVMSVMVITKFDAPASTMDEMAKGKHRETLEHVSQIGKSKGAIHHEFAEDADGNLMVVDEWESEDAFHAFFDDNTEIRELMADAGVTSPPETTSYRILSTADRF